MKRHFEIHEEDTDSKDSERLTCLPQGRQIRLAAMQAHSEVSIRDRVDEAVRARYRIKTDFRPDDVVNVWRISKSAKKGKWVGPGACIGIH